MREIRDKKELFALHPIDETFKGRREAGARLTNPREDLIREALWQGYRRVMGHKPRAMKARERNLKKDFLDDASASREDVELLAFLFAGHSHQPPAWITAKDFRRAIPPDRIGRLLTDLVRGFGTDYADAVLPALKTAYATRGERVVILREP
jgi:hypothetical protein